MPNPIRLAASNLALTATPTVSNLAAGLSATDILRYTKSNFVRNTSTANMVITLTWTASQSATFAYLQGLNLQSTATCQIALFTNTADVSPVYTSAATNPIVDILDYNAVQKSYAYGYSSTSIIYFPQTSFKKMTVTLSDATNPSGFLEAASIFIGKYSSYLRSFEYNNSIKIIDHSTSRRNEASDLISLSGIKYRTMSFDFSKLLYTDKKVLLDYMRLIGKSSPLFVSCYPEDTNKPKELEYMGLFKLSDDVDFKCTWWEKYATGFSLEEI